jgi:hypothetical protein
VYVTKSPPAHGVLLGIADFCNMPCHVLHTVSHLCRAVLLLLLPRCSHPSVSKLLVLLQAVTSHQSWFLVLLPPPTAPFTTLNTTPTISIRNISCRTHTQQQQRQQQQQRRRQGKAHINQALCFCALTRLYSATGDCTRPARGCRRCGDCSTADAARTALRLE